VGEKKLLNLVFGSKMGRNEWEKTPQSHFIFRF